MLSVSIEVIYLKIYMNSHFIIEITYFGKTKILSVSKRRHYIGLVSKRNRTVDLMTNSPYAPSHFNPASKVCSAGKPLGCRPAAPTAGTSNVCSMAGFKFTLFSSPTWPLGIVKDG